MSARMQQTRYRPDGASAWVKLTLGAGMLGLALGLAACGRGGAAWRPADTPAPPSPEESGYLRPPLPLTAQRAPGGGVMLSGRSGPQVRVRLSSPPPNSVAYGATARDDGEWSITTPASPDVGLFGVAEELVGRDVQGEGYVAVLPVPGPAGVLLRAGGGATVLVNPLVTRVRIAAVDYDGSGAAVVSGLARPGAPVRLFVDGAAAGEARVNDRGRFSISLTSSLKPGDHEVRVDCADQSVTAKFTLDHPRTISGLPYHGERTPVGWRIDWLTPGGGEQTTLIFDAAES